MCGQYGLRSSKSDLIERYQARSDQTFDLGGESTQYPGQDNPIYLVNERIYRVRWGFIPSFARRPLINARAETVLEKTTFSEAFQQRRCLIPANFFYEWQEVPGVAKKQKWQIRVEEEEIFSFAGICQRYTDPERPGETVLTYSMLTMAASPEMSVIHHRQPVVVSREDETFYMNPAQNPSQVLDRVLQYEPDWVFEKLE